MSSLQEQLLKAGLADKKKATQIKHEKRKKAKQQPKGHKVQDELKQQIEAEKRQKAEQDRALNEKKQAELKAKEERAKVKQMMQHYAVADIAGDSVYNYQAGAVAKSLKVSASIKQSIINGTLAICAMDDTVYLVPDGIARKLQEIEPEVVLVMHDRGSEQAVDEDDPYAEYVVPDDLEW